MAKKIRKKIPVAPLCECGCGKRVIRAENKFLLGHNNKKGNQDSSSKNDHSRFEPGNSYGKGRPCGSKNKVTVAAENLFEEESGAIARRAVEMALSGHPQMIKMVMERVVPIKKSSPVKLEGMPTVDTVESAGEAAEFILQSIASGKVSPLDGEILSRVLDKRLHALQITEIERELKTLQEKFID
jgi:hypothetical protein